MSLMPIGLQLYTVREDLALDFQGTIQRVADIGYAGVELAGDGGLSAAEMNALLKECGLKAAGSHHSLDDLQTKLAEIADYNLEIGNHRVVCPYLPKEFQDQGKKGYQKAAEIFKQIGMSLADKGLSLSYHNHSFEFVLDGDDYYLDILLGAAGDVLKAEIDTYWVRHGGADPVEYLKKYADRIDLLHIKDMNDDQEKSFAEVGSGILDWDAIFAAAEEASVKWFLVEQDVCPGPALESAKKSFEYLRSRGMVR